MVEVSTTYDSKIFASMRYVLLEDEWCKKETSKSQLDIPKVRKSMSNSMFFYAKEIEELKDRITATKEGIVSLQELISKLLQLSKETSIKIGKVRLSLDYFKQEGVKLLNRMFAHVETIKLEIFFSSNKLTISVQNSFSSFTKSVGKSYEWFCTNMPNT
ncbi:hypothetical protein FXO38_31583 [Capsicum annuum]|nr:hypothetical protein FXO38_31583 [Capsicum annuum]